MIVTKDNSDGNHDNINVNKVNIIIRRDFKGCTPAQQILFDFHEGTLLQGMRECEGRLKKQSQNNQVCLTGVHTTNQKTFSVVQQPTLCK